MTENIDRSGFDAENATNIPTGEEVLQAQIDKVNENRIRAGLVGGYMKISDITELATSIMSPK